MPQPTRFAVGAAPAARRNSWINPAVLAAVALAELLGGFACLAMRLGDAQAGLLLAPSGVVLIVCALVQLRLTRTAWRAGRLTTDTNPLLRFALWRWLVIGAVLAYLAALAIGPARYVGCAWIAAVSAWFVVLLLPLAASPAVAEDWRKWTDHRNARKLAWLVYTAIFLLVVGEVGLRAHRVAVEGLGPSAADLERDEADALAGVLPATAPLDLQVARLQPGRFRVAILGRPGTGQNKSDGYLARVGQAVPGLELVSLATSSNGSAANAAELSQQVEACDPDLVLVVIPVCQDLARQTPVRGWFDWRKFELAVLLLGRGDLHESPPAETPDDFESFLRALGPQLAACRTPIDDATRARWQRVFASLDHLIAGCRNVQVPVALVIVPAEFQLNRALCDTLLRRNGMAANRFDVELPQRRLARFAEHRNLPLIDLLPHLRLCRQSIYERHTTLLNDAGNSAAASAIAGWLESRYGVQLAAHRK